MENINKKYYILSAIIIIAVSLIWLLRDKDTRNYERTMRNNTSEVEDLVLDDLPEEKTSDEAPNDNLRGEIMQYLDNKVGELIPPPPAGDSYEKPSFYFVGNSIVYFEVYAQDSDEDGYKILYNISKDGDSFKLKELARYTEGEDDWKLISGKDDYTNYEQDIYDWDDESNTWEIDSDWEWEDEEEEWDDEELDEEDLEE